MQLKIRTTLPNDVEELCELLNEIIRIGGSTAIEICLTPQSFSDYFLTGPNHICCLVAEDEKGMLCGFQALERHDRLEDSCADIATFARRKPEIRGIGTALFEKTCEVLLEQGFESINATIRMDNISGITYYSKMGFKDHSTAKDIPLSDGTLVDRVSKRFSLT